MEEKMLKEKPIEGYVSPYPHPHVVSLKVVVGEKNCQLLGIYANGKTEKLLDKVAQDEAQAWRDRGVWYLYELVLPAEISQERPHWVRCQWLDGKSWWHWRDQLRATQFGDAAQINLPK